MKVIIYESNTGTAKKYAEALSAKTSLPCYALSGSNEVASDSEIIFIGWVMAGEIQGLKAARGRFTNIKTIIAVGMMKTEKQDKDIIAKNSITESFYSLPGAFDMNKLTGMYKMMMGMMLKMMKSKFKDSNGEGEAKVLSMFENGFDAYDESALDEIQV